MEVCAQITTLTLKLLTLFFLSKNNGKFDKSVYFFRIFEQATMFLVHLKEFP